MNRAEQNRLAELVERRIDGRLTATEFSELEASLLEDKESRRLFLDLTHQHAQLHLLGDSLVQHELQVAPARRVWAFAWGGLAAAACIVLCSLVVWRATQPTFIATLTASEHAAWESSSPTLPGTQLPRGFLKLATGIATIQFSSGARVILQAPAHLVLETPMRAKLLAGSAVIHVPDSAIGFVMDTPNGYAVDHGTEFAVIVDEEREQSTFEVLSGEISVARSHTDNAIRLKSDQLVVATQDAMIQQAATDLGEIPVSKEARALRLNTSRETSTIRHNFRDRFLRPEFLMVKTRFSKFDGFDSFKDFRDFDRVSLIEFDFARVESNTIESAQIRLNLVPTDMGYAAYVPEINTFAIYGVVDELAEGWTIDNLHWEDMPAHEQCEMLGTVSVPRGMQKGSFTLSNESLVSFLKADHNRRVTFLIVRLSGEQRSQGLVHAFASSHHPEASGPTLEISIREVNH